MPYFNKFDIAEAYYLFARHYHSGGDTSDSIFERLERMRFKPGLSLRQHDDPAVALSENGAEIYAALEVHHPDAVSDEDSCPHCEGEGGTGVVIGGTE